MSLYRNGKIKAIQPMKTYDVSEAAQAFRYLSSSTRIGKIAVSLKNPDSLLKVTLESAIQQSLLIILMPGSTNQIRHLLQRQ